MTTKTIKMAYWQGVLDAAPFILVVAPFGLLFGVVSTESGLNILETMAFSAILFAGAAQFTALQMLTENAPTIIAVVAALAVNLRMALYSAALTPYLGQASLMHRAFAAYFLADQAYACSVSAYERNPDWSVKVRLAYYFGTISSICPTWCAFTLAGALIGTAIPASFALDFAIPITFLAMVAPMLRSPAHLTAAVVAIVTSLLFAFLPFSLGLIVAGLAGMMAGAQVELIMTRKAQAHD